MIIAILISTIVWFVLALLLFFNPVVGKIYSSQEHYPAVRTLPKNAITMGKIMLAVFVQCILWAIVYDYIKSSLPGSIYLKTLIFGSILIAIKMFPRDIDRLLLTTYPQKRILIEFIIGCICAYAVALVFAYFIAPSSI